MLTSVHDNVGHLWCHLGDHNGTNALGKLFHCYLWMKTTFDRSVYPTAECTTYKLFLTTPADWGPIQTSPAASRPDFGLSQACYFLCLHGHLMGNHHFSEVSQLILTQLCWVFLSLLQIKTEKVKYIYMFTFSAQQQPYSALWSCCVWTQRDTQLLCHQKDLCWDLVLLEKFHLERRKKTLDKSSVIVLKISLQSQFLPGSGKSFSWTIQR